MEDYNEWPAIVAGLMLILAIFSWPYGYYILLRWVVAAAAIYLAVKLHQNGDNNLWVFVVLAILFNPITPVYGTRDFWFVPDLVGGALFLALGRMQNVVKKTS